MAGRKSLTTETKEVQKPVSDNKTTLSIINRLPRPLYRHILSFLDSTLPRTIHPKEGAFFAEVKTSPFLSSVRQEAMKIAHDLAHRVNVNETLEYIQKNPRVLQRLPSFTITDRLGRKITRDSIMGVLVALDEFEVQETKDEAKGETKGETKGQPQRQKALIPTLLDLFNDPKQRAIKQQLEQQLDEAFDEKHQAATNTRRKYYLEKIDAFIQQVIKTDIEPGASFKTLLELSFVQVFIHHAFQPSPEDDGTKGIIWDCWQLCDDYYELFSKLINQNRKVKEDRSHMSLDSIHALKPGLIDTAMGLAFQRYSEFRHLEIFNAGCGSVAAPHFLVFPVRFDILYV